MARLSKDTVTLLRIPYSFNLLPVFLFALSQCDHINVPHAWLSFFILHLLVYPASHGYNSYMDNDSGSIGGLKHPPKAGKELIYVSLALDFAALALSWWISWYFLTSVFFYILASRAYSYRGIRLKRYPIIGFFTVVFFQGFGVYSMTYFACNISNEFVAVYPEYFYIPFVVSSVMVAGIYPLTQVFQHDADARNDDYTLSMMLGYRGTFFFSTAMFLLSALLLFVYFYDLGRLYDYFIFVVFLFPVLCFFFWWFRKVYYDERQANYRYTMMMNAFSAGSMNAYFLLLIFLKP